MTSDAVWQHLESQLLQILSLPHNVIDLKQRLGLSPEQAVSKKLDEVRSGIAGVPTEEQFVGPKVFLRVAGPDNRVYSGEWWFDADQYDTIEASYSRVYFHAADRKAAVRDLLRELLAVSKEWNSMTEIWALELPPAEKIIGFSGIGTRQKLFANLPLTEKGNRLLVGKARQVFFPIKNPLWVRKFQNLAF